MNVNNVICAALSGAIALGFVASAGAQSHGQSYSHISKVQANRNNHLYVNVAGNFSQEHGCDERWWAGSELAFDEPQTKAMLQIALSSLLSRKPVHVVTVGCDIHGYPILAQIQIQEHLPPANNTSGNGRSTKPDNEVPPPPECDVCEEQPERP